MSTAGTNHLESKITGGRSAVSLSFQVVDSEDIPINSCGISHPTKARNLLRPQSALSTMQDVSDDRSSLQTTGRMKLSTSVGDPIAHKVKSHSRAKCACLTTKLLLHPPAKISKGFYERSNAPARPSSAPPVQPEDLAESRRLRKSVAKLRSLAINSTSSHPALAQTSMFSDNEAHDSSGLRSTSNLRDCSVAWDDNTG